MTLLELYTLINKIALKQPNVNTVVDDFYKLNKENIKYSAIVIQQKEHTKTNGWMIYNFYLGYVDRLNEDKENDIEIQSTGINILTNIVNKLYKSFDITYGNVVPFNQRFTAECSGCYLAISIPIAEGTCYEEIKDSYNNDFTDEDFR